MTFTIQFLQCMVYVRIHKISFLNVKSSYINMTLLTFMVLLSNSPTKEVIQGGSVEHWTRALMALRYVN